MNKEEGDSIEEPPNHLYNMQCWSEDSGLPGSSDESSEESDTNLNDFVKSSEPDITGTAFN